MKVKTNITRLILSTAVFAICVACGNETTTPRAVKAPGMGGRTTLIGVVESLVLPALQRTTPLGADITVEKVIGSSGGTIEIPAAGVTVTFPAGAVSSATTITMTAYAGNYAAYGFALHGLTFEKPVKVTQSLKGTTANGLPLQTLLGLKGGYLANGRSDIDGNGNATVTEVLSVSISIDTLLGGLFDAKASFSITHFSGYMTGWGRSSSSPSSQ